MTGVRKRESGQGPGRRSWSAAFAKHVEAAEARRAAAASAEVKKQQVVATLRAAAAIMAIDAKRRAEARERRLWEYAPWRLW